MSDIENMTRGGHGAHWDGCENVHWDCRIARMEQRITELEAMLIPYDALDYAIYSVEHLLREVPEVDAPAYKAALSALRKARGK